MKAYYKLNAIKEHCVLFSALEKLAEFGMGKKYEIWGFHNSEYCNLPDYDAM